MRIGKGNQARPAEPKRMPRLTLSREWYIPASAQPVADPQSSAVAYVYRNAKGQPSAMMFAGKAAKPAQHYHYPSQRSLEADVVRFFEATRAKEARRVKAAEERKAFRHTYKVGDVLRAIWGYEQTNVDYYEVTATTPGTVTVRKIAKESADTGSYTGQCAPVPGAYIGEPITRRPNPYGVKIDDSRHATPVEFTEAAGVRVYKSSYWSSYG